MEAIRTRSLLLALAATSVVLALAILAPPLRRDNQHASAGFVERVYVNSAGNSSDGNCEGPPNDEVVGGECTLREAIEKVNEGGAGSIGFISRVFGSASPGVIDLENGDGCLPKIVNDGVTIDLAGANVIIDGDEPTNGVQATCQAAIVVEVTSNGFDFTLVGNDDLLVRDLTGDGVALDCGPFVGPNALRHISITGVSAEHITGRVIVDECPTPTPTPTSTPTATFTPTISSTPTITSTPTNTVPPTATPTITNTPAPTNTPSPSRTPTLTPAPTNTRTPTRTPTNTPTPHPGVKGDANCDGVLSSIDATIVLQVSAGVLPALPCDANADIDHDGAITSLDAALILQLVAELFSA